MAKILLSDVDGTLIEDGKAISEKNFEMMRELQKQGHYVALCTGRNHVDIQPVLNNINIPYDYLVLCNGSYIANKQGDILFSEAIPKELGREVIQTAIDMKELVVCFCDDDVCPVLVDGKTHVLGLNGIEPVEMDFFELLEQSKQFHMLSLHHKDLDIEKIRKAAAFLKEKYPTGIETHLNQQYIDVVPVGHSKGTGLIKLISLLKNIDESYAIGDSFNDLPMIEAADVGATFSYAKKEIQEQADVVVDYVYELIEKMLS